MASMRLPMSLVKVTAMEFTLPEDMVMAIIMVSMRLPLVETMPMGYMLPHRGSSSNWAGYFSGNVYSSGSYQGSDRKLKSDILPLSNAVQLIKALKPSSYLYKTNEYKQMELPEGRQYGLVADEVKQVFPRWSSRSFNQRSMKTMTTTAEEL